MNRNNTWKKNISKALKGRKLDDEWKAKLSEAHKGKEPWNKGKSKYTKEQKRELINEKNKKYCKEHKEERTKKKREREYKKRLILIVLGLRRAYPVYISPIKGIKLTEEHKKKISESHIGIKHSAETIEKIRKTKIKNKSWIISKDENYIENIFKEKNINFIKQYKSEKYPFNCDFYLPNLDIYIEYQGNWTHGKYKREILGPFDINNTKHKEVLNEWRIKAETKQYFVDAIKTWTVRDPLKREIAKKNNLNWLEFFTLTDFNKWLEENEIR